MYAPDSPVALDYLLWMTTGDLAFLRKAYKEMAAVSRRARSISDLFRFCFRFSPKYLIPQTTLTMTERQIAVRFLSMAGVVLVSQWKQIKQELFGSGVSDAVVQAVNEETRHIRILKDHVEWVERMATKMTTCLEYAERYEHLEDQYDWLVALKNECFDQYSYLYAGIDQLLNSRKLNSALVHPPFVRKALTKLSQKVRKEHQDLLIDDYRDLLLLDTSFVLLRNFTLDLYTHIPVADHSITMSLLELVQSPIFLSTHSQLFSVEPYRIHLAVGDTQQNGYKELSWRDLRACKVIKGSHYCPSSDSARLGPRGELPLGPLLG